jgi:hypothetical protein
MHLHGGVIATTTDDWNMLVASRDGDLHRVQALAAQCPALLTCQYDYTCPLHLAVREGHLELVRYLVEQAGIDPNYQMRLCCKNRHLLSMIAGCPDPESHSEVCSWP